MIKSGITQEELIKWGGAEVFNQALALCNSGVVKNVEYDDETLVVSGKIEQSDGWGMPVSFTLKAKGTIKSNCPCYANQKLSQVCPHVVAVGIALMVKEMEDDEAPQTDDLEDDNVIEVCDKYGIAMAFTGMRLFHH